MSHKKKVPSCFKILSVTDIRNDKEMAHKPRMRQSYWIILVKVKNSSLVESAVN